MAIAACSPASEGNSGFHLFKILESHFLASLQHGRHEFFKPEGDLFFVLFVWWPVMFSWNLET